MTGNNVTAGEFRVTENTSHYRLVKGFTFADRFRENEVVKLVDHNRPVD